MLVRQATPEDLPLIQALERQTETAAHWGSQDYDALFVPDAPRRIALVAAEDSQFTGFIIARCSDDEWEIENVVVAGDQRRRGVGSTLVSELLRRASQGEAVSVLLEVRESNMAARQLYEKHNFSEVGRRHGYYRSPPEDALLLKVSIAVL